MDPSLASLGLTSAMLVSSGFQSQLPPLYELRGKPDDPDLRATEIQMLGLALAAGLALTLAVRSPVPLVAAAGMAAFMVAQYEAAIRA